MPASDNRFGRWLEGVVAQTAMDGATIVAHSRIGSLTARLAAVGRLSAARLVLYAAPATGPYRLPLRLRYVAVRFAVRPSPANAERFQRFALLDLDATRRRDPAWFESFDAYTRARASVPHVKRMMRRLVAHETKRIPDGDLNHIDLPTTLLWGRHDRMVPLTVGQSAAARHGWPLRVIEAAAHVPHLEQPAAFVAAIAAVTGRA